MGEVFGCSSFSSRRTHLTVAENDDFKGQQPQSSSHEYAVNEWLKMFYQDSWKPATIVSLHPANNNLAKI